MARLDPANLPFPGGAGKTKEFPIFNNKKRAYRGPFSRYPVKDYVLAEYAAGSLTASTCTSAAAAASTAAAALALTLALLASAAE
jgi:hypothetical protein